MKKATLILVVLILAACNNKEEEAHTHSWYREHDAERKAEVASCKDDAAKQISANCANAQNAESDIYINGKDFYRNGGQSSNTAPNLTAK